MHLPSRLSTSTLGDLLGALHRQGTTGLLELCELWTPNGATLPGRQHRIQLHGGLVTAVETPLVAPKLGELLEQLGVLGEASVGRYAVIAAHGGRQTGEVLIAAGLATREAVVRALRDQLRARLDVLFGIEEASICFHTARPLAEALRRIGPLSPGEFLHGRPRARDRSRAAGRAAGACRGAPSPRAERTSSPRAEHTSSSRAHRLDHARLRALQLLGLGEGASEAEVRRAFRRLAVNLHPDRAPLAGAAQCTARFAELSAAYHLLVA